MKRKLVLVFSVVSFCLSGAFRAAATSYTVKASGGGNYTTIQACVNAMSAGDTCTVYAGTYNETVNLRAGSAGSYSTLDVNPGDTVTINGSVTVNSHTKIIGFTVSDVASPATSPPCVTIAGNATDWYVTNNVLTSCGGRAGAILAEPRNYASTGYGYIQGNTLSYGCSTAASPNTCAAMVINGSHHLISNNDISHVSDGVTNTAGSYNVYRNNTMHDALSSECGSQSGNCHIDFIASEPVTSGGAELANAYNLYEGNAIWNSVGGNNHVFLAQGDACTGCQNLIVRFNWGYQVGSFWLLNDVGVYNHVKDYNNTMIDIQYAGAEEDLLSFLDGNTYGAAKNDLMYNSGPNATEWYTVDSTTDSTFSGGHNLGYLSSCAPTCRFTTVEGIGMGQAGVSNITNQDPKLANIAMPPSGNFNLQPGSPAIRAGGPLTTVTSATGSGSVITVADPDYFQDGMGLTAQGVQPDWIRIGASTTVQISAVNYSTGVITLANSIGWNSGDPVYLYKSSNGATVLFGNAPDIGAFPYVGTAPAPPTSLSVVVQ